MNGKLYYRLYDERLLQDLRRQLGLPGGALRATGLGHLGALRHELVQNGWMMEIRECAPETFSTRKDEVAVRILVAGERAMLLTSFGRRLTVATPSGRRVRLSTAAAFDGFDADVTARMAERRRRWRELGLREKNTVRAERSLGAHRSEALVDWLETNPDSDAAAALATAARFPSLVPVDLEPDGAPLPPWLEIRLSRTARFSSERSPWRAVGDLIAQERGLLLLIVLLAVLASPLGYTMAMTTAFIMDHARSALEAPVAAFGLLAAAFVVSRGLALAQQYTGVRLSGRLGWRLTRSFMLRVLDARIDTVRRLGDGDLYTRLSDLNALQSVLLGQALSFLFGLATVFGGAVYLVHVAPFVIVPTLAGFGVVAGLLFLYLPRLRALRWDMLTTTSAYRDRALERMEGRRVFKHVDAAGFLFARIDPYLTRLAEFSQQSTVLGARLSSATAVVGIAHIAVVTWLAANRYQGGDASLGSLTVVIGLSVAALGSLLQLMNLVPAFVAAEPSVARVQEVICATEPEPAPQTIPARRTVAADVEVRDLRFAWHDGSSILNGASIRLPAGTWTCLTGPSGCGKSTLAGVLGGILEPDHGTIVLDGTPWREFAPSVLRHRIALITQDSFLFNLTIRENLTLGATGCTTEQLLSVLKTTGLLEFIARQPRGLDQLVGENGARMSLGEKCRLSLARGLLRRPGLVILDETLSRLDRRTRESVREGLRSLGVTVLILTHDLAETEHCDQVLTMDQGRIRLGDRHA